MFRSVLLLVFVILVLHWRSRRVYSSWHLNCVFLLYRYIWFMIEIGLDLILKWIRNENWNDYIFQHIWFVMGIENWNEIWIPGKSRDWILKCCSIFILLKSERKWNSFWRNSWNMNYLFSFSFHKPIPSRRLFLSVIGLVGWWCSHNIIETIPRSKWWHPMGTCEWMQQHNKYFYEWKYEQYQNKPFEFVLMQNRWSMFQMLSHYISCAWWGLYRV